MKPSILDHPTLSRRMFFPRKGPLPDRFEVETDGGIVACLRYEPHPGAGTLLHFHGNGEVVADYVPDFARRILAMGVNLCLAEYRGYGASTGTPALAAMLPDGERIVESLGIPDDRVVAFGRSIGSIYAIEFAARRPGIAGLILESGIAEVDERIRVRVSATDLGATDAELDAEVARLFDHQAKLARYAGPLLVLHARHDDLIDVEHARKLHAWAGTAEADKELKIFPYGDHNSIAVENESAYFDKVEAFLKRAGIVTNHHN